MSEHDKNLLIVQQRLEYEFEHVVLLKLALTHPSYAHEHPEEGGERHHNQRLEFLGDAVLDFLIAAWLYREFADFSEGALTRLRATLVQTRTLARLAEDLSIGEALRLGRGEAESGGHKRSANLCDALEALVGAFYLDSDQETVWDSLRPWFEREVEVILESRAYLDAKSHLQEWAQAEIGVTPAYEIVDEVGPDHAKEFTAQVFLADRVVGEGKGRSKRAAEQGAARQALRQLLERKKSPPDDA
jgi:ribonuclease-3